MRKIISWVNLRASHSTCLERYFCCCCLQCTCELVWGRTHANDKAPLVAHHATEPSGLGRAIDIRDKTSNRFMDQHQKLHVHEAHTRNFLVRKAQVHLAECSNMRRVRSWHDMQAIDGEWASSAEQTKTLDRNRLWRIDPSECFRRSRDSWVLVEWDRAGPQNNQCQPRAKAFWSEQVETHWTRMRALLLWTFVWQPWMQRASPSRGGRSTPEPQSQQSAYEWNYWLMNNCNAEGNGLSTW